MLRKALLPILVSLTLLFGWQAFADIGRGEGMVTVQFINIGQGDASLITTAGGRRILIDSGNDDAKANADASIISFLRNNGIDKVDVATISHYDMDHAGGMSYVAYAYSPEMLILPQPMTEEEKDVRDGIVENCTFGTKVVYAKAGDKLAIGEDLTADVIWANSEGKNNNERSIVLKVHCFDDDFLYTGDIGIETEQMMLESEAGASLKSDVVKVPHHGSKYSSSSEFFAAANPLYAIICVGAKNTYGHPTQDAMDRITESGAKILRTDLDGTVSFLVNKDGIKRQ